MAVTLTTRPLPNSFKVHPIYSTPVMLLGTPNTPSSSSASSGSPISTGKIGGIVGGIMALVVTLAGLVIWSKRRLVMLNIRMLMDFFSNK
jgi:nitrate reductase gamma subunit